VSHVFVGKVGSLLILRGGNVLALNEGQAKVQHGVLGVLLSLHGMPHPRQLNELQQTMLPLADVPNVREGSALTIKVHKTIR
jgi:hypothetical protein